MTAETTEEPSPGAKSPPQLSNTHKVLIGVVAVGVLVIATIGFAGSYQAVRDLAERKGFGAFAPFFPIGIDAGIVVLLALDLLLTWLRIGFPLLRQTAWMLTAATIAFNGAAAWPDPLGVGMHAVIPVLFVVSVEAARHAIGRIADITADKHMEGVRISRWLLAPVPTLRLWRRMKLWELRGYDEVIRFEQDRLVYQARLRAHYGRAWRRKAPVEARMPLRLARYGIPLAETGATGLAAAGITVPPPVPELTSSEQELVEPSRAIEVPDKSVPVAFPEQQQLAGHPQNWEIPGEVGSRPVPAVEPVTESRPEVVERVRAPVSAKGPGRSRVDARIDVPPHEPAVAGTNNTLEQVKSLFRALGPEDRALSNRALAERWASQLGLSADSIRRRYLKPAKAAVEEEEGASPPQ